MSENASQTSTRRTDGGLAYELTGEDRPGPGVVLVHGWCCDRSLLSAQRDHLGAAHPVVSLDLRGHGDSPRREGYTVSDLADDVAEVAAAAGLQRPLVVGHSLGGLVALECAARGSACAAVLLDPAPMLDEQGKGYFASSVDKVAADGDGSWRRRFASRLFLDGDTAGRDTVPALMSSGEPAVAAEVMRGMAEYDAASALRRVEVPVLVVSADRGEDLTGVRELCPSLRDTRLQGVGHFVQLERSDEVNAAIDELLTQLPG